MEKAKTTTDGNGVKLLRFRKVDFDIFLLYVHLFIFSSSLIKSIPCIFNLLGSNWFYIFYF